MPNLKKHNLFLISFDVLTFIVWAWLVAEFLTKERVSIPTWFSSAYLLILVFYVTDKEIRRWRKQYSSRYRKGEYFVFLWGLTLAAIVAFSVWVGNHIGYKIPPELPTIAGAVLILYIITEYLKEEFKKK